MSLGHFHCLTPNNCDRKEHWFPKKPFRWLMKQRNECLNEIKRPNVCKKQEKNLRKVSKIKASFCVPEISFPSYLFIYHMNAIISMSWDPLEALTRFVGVGKTTLED